MIARAVLDKSPRVVPDESGAARRLVFRLTTDLTRALARLLAARGPMTKRELAALWVIKLGIEQWLDTQTESEHSTDGSPT